jgi:uncharacterized SAM-binding protein YcdF (DUF218 family)
MILFAARSYLTVSDEIVPVDVIVVLGCPANNDGSISPVLKSRVDEAIRLYAQQMAPHILLSGGAVYNAHAEAHNMRDYAVSRGIPKDRIFVEDQSRDTFLNLCHVNQIIKRNGWHSVLVVTSHYHTQRISLLNHRYFGLDLRLVPIPYPSQVPWQRKLYRIYAEYVLIAYSLIKKLRCS